MSRFPGIEEGILRALELEAEVHPPQGRLAEEYFWQAASALQSRGLCSSDQLAGVVRRAAGHPAQDTVASRLPDLMPRGQIGREEPEPERLWGRFSALGLLRALVEALQPLGGDGVSAYSSAWEIDPHGHLDGEEWAEKVRTLCREASALLETPPSAPIPVADLRARCRLLAARWRDIDERWGGKSAYLQAAIDLEEVIGETEGSE